MDTLIVPSDHMMNSEDGANALHSLDPITGQGVALGSPVGSEPPLDDAAGSEAPSDDATGSEAPPDNAAGSEASPDEAVGSEAPPDVPMDSEPSLRPTESRDSAGDSSESELTDPLSSPQQVVRMRLDFDKLVNIFDVMRVSKDEYQARLVPNTKLTMNPDNINKQQEDITPGKWLIVYIKAARVAKGQLEYLLRWFQYPDSLSSWVAADQVTAADLVSRFWDDVGMTREEFEGAENLVKASPQFIEESKEFFLRNPTKL
ncbi:hypothetical protein BJV77DRAFT_1072221 [Russula vinacea]|nr:hypothetical protein BJV77DRAFT_1072221 [Russula vinacea]